MGFKFKTALLFLILFFCLGLVVPSFASSAYEGFQTVGKTAGVESRNDLMGTAQTVLSGALGAVAFIFFGMVLYGGLRWMTARGKDELKEKAINAIESAIIGLVIVVGAYAITTFVFSQINKKASTAAKTTATTQTTP